MTIRGWTSVVFALAVATVWIIVLVRPEERLPVGIANGQYRGTCCGLLTLKDGELSAGPDRVRYVIERDKVGPYLLPESYVGVAGVYFDVDRRAPPTKLRLNSETSPDQIELADTRRGLAIPFERAGVE